eukprot:385346-Prymnesium_polylepis.2
MGGPAHPTRRWGRGAQYRAASLPVARPAHTVPPRHRVDARAVEHRDACCASSIACSLRAGMRTDAPSCRPRCSGVRCGSALLPAPALAPPRLPGVRAPLPGVFVPPDEPPEPPVVVPAARVVVGFDGVAVACEGDWDSVTASALASAAASAAVVRWPPSRIRRGVDPDGVSRVSGFLLAVLRRTVSSRGDVGCGLVDGGVVCAARGGRGTMSSSAGQVLFARSRSSEYRCSVAVDATACRVPVGMRACASPLRTARGMVGWLSQLAARAEVPSAPAFVSLLMDARGVRSREREQTECLTTSTRLMAPAGSARIVVNEGALLIPNAVRPTH